MWLLLVIHLTFTPEPQVIHVEITQTFSTEHECIKKLKAIPKKDTPSNINLGCVPFKIKNNISNDLKEQKYNG